MAKYLWETLRKFLWGAAMKISKNSKQLPKLMEKLSGPACKIQKARTFCFSILQVLEVQLLRPELLHKTEEKDGQASGHGWLGCETCI
jgi:hypothetical protein